MTDIAEIMARGGRGATFDGKPVTKILSRDVIDAITAAALTALQERGFAVVPVVPTEEMITAADDIYDTSIDTAGFYEATWSAMLAASPGSKPSP